MAISTAGSLNGRPHEGPNTVRRGRLAVMAAVALLASSCYLPRADVDRAVETFVLASVSQCSSESVGGALRNDADVAVRVVLTSMWLDLSSEVYHEVVLELPRVEAHTTEQWTAFSTEEVASPLLCTVEASTIEALE